MGIVPDLELARALEGAEAETCRAFCETAARLYPKAGMRAIRCGGGVGAFYGPSDPLNAVKGVALNGAVDLREWGELERVFFDSGSPVVIDLCPLADEAFVAMLMERGYRIGSFETVTYRRLDDGGAVGTGALAPRIEIVEVGREWAGEWSRVLDVGFADGGEPMKFAVDFGLVRAHLPDSVMLLARVDGQSAGGAGISMHGGVAHMAGAAVLPEFRGRGIQRALTAARIRIASERGCTLAKLDVRAGSVSHRNAARCGFQVAYTRPQLIGRNRA